MGRPSGDIRSREEYASFIWPDCAGDNIEERCLPGAVRSDQTDDAALFEIERDILQRLKSGEGFADVLHGEQDHGRALARIAPKIPCGTSTIIRMRTRP